MYCQICSKNSATVHFTELAGNKKVEVHICQDCAREKGFLLDMGNYSSELVFGTTQKKAAEGETRCRLCKMKYSDFKAAGRLGCGECYDVFAGDLAATIRKIHGAAQHIGRTPDLSEEALRSREIERHKKKLHDLVGQERFEEASRLRDKIKNMEL